MNIANFDVFQVNAGLFVQGAVERLSDIGLTLTVEGQVELIHAATAFAKQEIERYPEEASEPNPEAAIGRGQSWAGNTEHTIPTIDVADPV